MSARTALLNVARRAAQAPVRVTRRNMSGGGSIEEEVEKKTRKLEKLRAKKDEAHEEWLGLQEEFRVEREETLEVRLRKRKAHFFVCMWE